MHKGAEERLCFLRFAEQLRDVGFGFDDRVVLHADWADPDIVGPTVQETFDDIFENTKLGWKQLACVVIFDRNRLRGQVNNTALLKRGKNKLMPQTTANICLSILRWPRPFRHSPITIIRRYIS